MRSVPGSTGCLAGIALPVSPSPSWRRTVRTAQRRCQQLRCLSNCHRPKGALVALPSLPRPRQTPHMADDVVLSELQALEIETPSWGYGNSGTRFHVYPWPGAARTVWERIDDAALVHR